MRRVGIVGGGPAGMMAAIAAGEAGAEVLLLEGNEKLGKKLYITGKGRCNVTNAAPAEEFLRGYARNGRFLHSAFANLTNEDLMRRIEGAGVPLKVERGGRVFPVSDKASDITRALERMMREGGARVRLRARVQAARKEGEAFLVTGDFGTERFDALVLACGVGSACFSYLFGGSVFDALAALLCGFVLQIFLNVIDRGTALKFITNLAASALVAFCAVALFSLGLGDSLDKIIIGSIIRLVPGVALTTSIRDFLNGDYLSGTIRMIDAFLIGGCIAIGVGAVVMLYLNIAGGAPIL